MMDKSAIQELANAQAISAAAVALNEAFEVVALPEGWQTVDLEQFQATRRRARGSMTTRTIESFAAYIKDHAEAGSTVFVNDEKMEAVAVLNLGSPTEAGHADNTATYSPVKTAAFKALQAVTNGAALTQKQAAEFFEDWRDSILCFGNDDNSITTAAAIAAIRNVTIDALRKIEATVSQLSESRSAFESVAATSKTPIPTLIYFNCAPYAQFTSRDFVLRLGILTNEALPRISLRIVKLEEMQEDMTAELVDKVQTAIGDTSVVAIGSYQKQR